MAKKESEKSENPKTENFIFDTFGTYSKKKCIFRLLVGEGLTVREGGRVNNNPGAAISDPMTSDPMGGLTGKKRRP